MIALILPAVTRFLSKPADWSSIPQSIFAESRHQITADRNRRRLIAGEGISTATI
ncbi:MAG: hypothetical protein IPL01_21765 [Acidobacteria bacterium]|nr:hypothetical protein [Acidobacteriota bacterium]